MCKTISLILRGKSRHDWLEVKASNRDVVSAWTSFCVGSLAGCMTLYRNAVVLLAKQPTRPFVAKTQLRPRRAQFLGQPS